MRSRPVLRFGVLFWLGALTLVVIGVAQISAGIRPVHEIDTSTAASGQTLDEQIQAKNYPEFERRLTSAKLSANERWYFEGILEDRRNRPLRAKQLLEKALPELVKSNRKRASVALAALAEEDFMIGRYADSTARYAKLLEDFEPYLDPAEKRSAQDNHDTIALLRDSSPQGISGERSFRLACRADPIGDLDIPVKIGTGTEWWTFDTGANISTITRSTAKRLGLNISKGHAQTQGGATGVEVPLSTAVIPVMKVGEAVIHNVVVLVMNDKDLKINLGGQGTYQINGILGYPVLVALQSFTVTRNEMQIGSSSTPSTRTARLYVDEMTPLIAGSFDGHDLIFQFDTGNTGADLTPRFSKQFPQRFTSLKSERGNLGGAGGTQNTTIHLLPQLDLNFGSATVSLKNVALFGDRGELLDKLYGNLGQGLLKQFRNYTIDFTNMQLALGDPVSK